MNALRVAFVHHPLAENSARLETMSFALTVLRGFLKAGCRVTLYHWETETISYSEIAGGPVRFVNATTPHCINTTRLKHYREHYWGWLPRAEGYDLVVGVGQPGAWQAATLARANRCPWIYLNDEFPSSFPESPWQELEAKACETCLFAVVPDEGRVDVLRRELRLPGLRVMTIPNCPWNISVTPTDWRKRLGMPEEQPYMLHAGSLADWSQIPEILFSMKDWPEEIALVLHCQNQNSFRPETLDHLIIPGRVFWSLDPVPLPELNALVEGALGNFALYRNTGINDRMMGLASGKLCRALRLGSPVITSAFVSLKFISDQKLGWTVRHPNEIYPAVQELQEKRAEYSGRCHSFADAKLDPSKHWQAFARLLSQTSGICLTSQTKL